jgi:hypothetical protein
LGAQIPSLVAAGMLPADVPPDFGYVTDAAQKQAQEKLAKLVPNAKHITNTNSGHEIHKEQPQLVINAIREVVDAVRSGAGSRRNEISGRVGQWHEQGGGPRLPLMALCVLTYSGPSPNLVGASMNGSRRSSDAAVIGDRRTVAAI